MPWNSAIGLETLPKGKECCVTPPAGYSSVNCAFPVSLGGSDDSRRPWIEASSSCSRPWAGPKWSPFRPSTKSFLREAKATPHYTPFDLLHGYVYQRWPFLYIGIATGEHPLARIAAPIFSLLHRIFTKGRQDHRFSNVAEASPGDGCPARSAQDSTFADTYHGKVLPLKAATKIVTVGKNISLTDLEQVIPYTRARDLVLKNPDHIVVLECPCRAARSNPCRPLDVCMIVGEPFASFVSEHHPQRSRRITPAEAVEILRAEDERGHVHHAFFKDAMLGRFYAICNCCSCCCGAMQAHRHGTAMLASSGYVCNLDDALCAACGTCSQFCQFEAIQLVAGKNTVDREKCMGCGVCVTKCEHGALSLVHDPAKGKPLEITEMMAEATENA